MKNSQRVTSPSSEDAQRAHRVKMEQERQDFKVSLEAEHDTGGHPKADLLWDISWDLGHSAGFDEVRQYYEMLKPLLSERTLL